MTLYPTIKYLSHEYITTISYSPPQSTARKTILLQREYCRINIKNIDVLKYANAFPSSSFSCAIGRRYLNNASPKTGVACQCKVA